MAIALLVSFICTCCLGLCFKGTILTAIFLSAFIVLLQFTAQCMYNEYKASPPWTLSRKISFVIFIVLTVGMMLLSHYKPEVAQRLFY